MSAVMKEVQAFLCREREKKIDGFGIDCWCEDVPEVCPFLIPEGDEAALVFGRFAHRVELEFEIHLCGDDLICPGCFWINFDLVTSDLIVTAELFEHLKFAVNCRGPF